MSFPKLLAKLRREAEVDARKDRRAGLRSPFESLFGPWAGWQVRDGHVCHVERSGNARVGYAEIVEQVYPLAEFWVRVQAGTEKTRGNN